MFFNCWSINSWSIHKSDPGVNRPAMEEHPIYLANFRTALCAYGRLATTNTSAGFSTAAMALAASTIFSQVFFRLIMLIPSVFFLEDVLLHCSLTIVRPNMGGGSQHLCDVILSNSKGVKSSRHCERTFL